MSGGVGTTEVKRERERQRRANEEAGFTEAWSSLFMRQDTVSGDYTPFCSPLFPLPPYTRLSLHQTIKIPFNFPFSPSISPQKLLKLEPKTLNFGCEMSHFQPKNLKKKRNWVSEICTFKRPKSDKISKVILKVDFFGVQVVEAMSARLGVEKRVLLDPSSADLAVRVALAETQIVTETKSSLAESGADLAVLERYISGEEKDKKDRSNRVLLVKNLPFSTSDAELADLFGARAPRGGIRRLILPPTKALALVSPWV